MRTSSAHYTQIVRRWSGDHASVSRNVTNSALKAVDSSRFGICPAPGQRTRRLWAEQLMHLIDILVRNEAVAVADENQRGNGERRQRGFVRGPFRSPAQRRC
jgi:hypothetical protein